MYNAYIDLLERSYEYDLAVARAKSKKNNIQERRKYSLDNMSDRQFVKRYRLSKDLYYSLVNELTPHMPPTLRSDALDVETKILVALAFYASGSYQTVVGDSRKHCVSQASVSKAVRQVTMAINKSSIINKYIAFPFRQHEREQIKRGFYRRFRMPGVLGCIDGTHVAIVRPAVNEERFFNRKGYHSLNVLIICDSNLNVMCVDPSYPGSTHDSVVWANHSLKQYVEILHTSGEDLYLLGDSGYPLRPTMMIPVSDPQPNTPEEHYQSLHLTARSTVERCIGVLKARFRCLLVDRKLHYSPEVAARITNACCVLHNIAHRANTPFTPLTAEEAARERGLTDGASGIGRVPRGSRALTDLELGRARRQALINRLWTNRAIEYQFRMPGVLGCIDGTHVAIVRPAVNEERFFNRKGYHSLKVLIICNSKLNVMCVDPSYPGSTHDSVVWANLFLKQYVEILHTSGEDLYSLGDSGYPLRPTLMIPVSDPQPNTPEEHYQSLHLTARSTVERCIGVLKARFRCLLVDRKLHYSPEVAARITNAYCVLHNIAHRANTPFTPLTAEEAARERGLTDGASGIGRSDAL